MAVTSQVRRTRPRTTAHRAKRCIGEPDVIKRCATRQLRSLPGRAARRVPCGRSLETRVLSKWHPAMWHSGRVVIAAMPKAVGRYQIIDRLAVGGMAELFKATLTGDHGFEKLVAIKKILPHLATDRTFVEMFIDEARITAQL